MYLHGSASIVICSFAEGFLLFRTHPLGHSPSSHRAWRVVFDHVVGSRMLYCDYSLPLNFKLQTFKLSSRLIVLPHDGRFKCPESVHLPVVRGQNEAQT